MPEPSHSSERDDPLDKPTKGKSKSSKPKDLSHVPCKFFKVGGCTAGPDCPFSHQQPGQPKDVCTWFVKGQCKFGHKCALAHVLPGQPMSMDRKNKKEAQQAAQKGGANGTTTGGGASGSGGASADRERERSRKRRDVRGSSGGELMLDGVEPQGVVDDPFAAGAQQYEDDNPLTLQGSGASPPGPTIRIRQPTGAATHKVSPVQITAPIPAPPVSATDFAFGIPDDLDLPHPEPASVAAGTSTSSGTLPGNSLGPASIPMAIPSPNKSILPPRMQAQRRGSGDPLARSPPGFERAGHSRPASLAISPPGAGFAQQDQPLISPTRKRMSGGMDFGFGPIGSPSRANYMQQGTSPPAPGSRVQNGISSQFSPGTSPVGNGNGNGNGTGSGNGYLSTMSTSPFEGDKGLFMSYSLDSRALAGAMSNFAAGRERERLNAIQERTTRRGGDDAAVEDDDLEDFLPSSLTDLLTPEERERRKSRTGTRPVMERFPASLPATSHLDGLRGIWGDQAGNASGGGGGAGLPATSPPPSAGLGGRTSMMEEREHHSPSLLSTSNQSTAFLNHALNRPQMQSLRSFDPHLLIDRPSLSGEPSQRMMGHGSRGNRASLDASQRLAPFARDPVPPEHMPGQSLPQGLAAGLSRLHLQPSQKSPIPTPGTTPGAAFSAGLDMWSSSSRGGGAGTGMGMSWEHRSLTGLASGQITPSGSQSGGLGSGMHTPSGSWREAHSPTAWGGREGLVGGGGGEMSLSYPMPRGLGMGLGSAQTTPSKSGAPFPSASAAGLGLGGGLGMGGGSGSTRRRGGGGFGDEEDIFDLDLDLNGPGESRRAGQAGVGGL